MSGLQLVVLALVQGITEFLPISSQAHLILADMVFGWPDSGLAIRAALHVGTLFAVIIYFRRDVGRLVYGAARLAIGRSHRDSRLIGYLVVATLPVVIAGGAAKYYGVLASVQSATVIAWTSLGFGILLFVADRLNLTVRKVEHMTLVHATFIGLAQVLALLPGTSRAGITITAARMLGYERTEAARFSMLLSIPTIIAAGVLIGFELYRAGDALLTAHAIIAAGLAFLAALAAISLMMAWLRRSTFTPFVIYRVGLGGIMLWWLYT